MTPFSGVFDEHRTIEGNGLCCWVLLIDVVNALKSTWQVVKVVKVVKVIKDCPLNVLKER